jgi:DNA-binding transcriptional LysR family regulator
MTLKELDFFYALCKNPHVSKLSKKLEISQSAISLAIKSLETKLGEPLFDRIGKKLVLNERGREFKEITYTNFLALKDAKSYFKKDEIAGTLKIASSKTIGNFITSMSVFDFLSLNKEVKIEHQIENSSYIIEQVKLGNLDMGFIETTCRDDEIIKEVLAEDELVVVCSDKSLKKEQYIDELYDKKWILREKGSGTRDTFVLALGIPPQKSRQFLIFFNSLITMLLFVTNLYYLPYHFV